MEALGINITSIFIYSILFGIVYKILNKYLTGPLIDIIEKRKNDAKEGVRIKKQIQDELDSIAKVGENKLNEARLEAKSIKDSVRESGKIYRQEIIEKAKKEASLIIEKANDRLDIERKKMQTEFADKLEQEARKMAKELYNMDKVNIDKKYIDSVISNL